MYNPIMNARLAQERYEDQLRIAERNRLAARARQGQLTLSRRVARPLGRALLWLGAGLLRYGRAEQPASRPYRPSVRIELN